MSRRQNNALSRALSEDISTQKTDVPGPLRAALRQRAMLLALALLLIALAATWLMYTSTNELGGAHLVPPPAPMLVPTLAPRLAPR